MQLQLCKLNWIDDESLTGPYKLGKWRARRRKRERKREKIPVTADREINHTESSVLSTYIKWLIGSKLNLPHRVCQVSSQATLWPAVIKFKMAWKERSRGSERKRKICLLHPFFHSTYGLPKWMKRRWPVSRNESIAHSREKTEKGCEWAKWHLHPTSEIQDLTLALSSSNFLCESLCVHGSC